MLLSRVSTNFNKIFLPSGRADTAGGDAVFGSCGYKWSGSPPPCTALPCPCVPCEPCRIARWDCPPSPSHPYPAKTATKRPEAKREEVAQTCHPAGECPPRSGGRAPRERDYNPPPRAQGWRQGASHKPPKRHRPARGKAAAPGARRFSGPTMRASDTAVK